MKTWVGWALGGLLIWAPAIAGAQSLADIAAREKARRETLRSSPPAPVIDDEALTRERAPSRPHPPRESSPKITVDEPADGAPPTATSVTDRLTAKEVRDLRETWARVWAEQMAAAEDELEISVDNVRQCRTAELYVFVPLAIDCYGSAERLALARFRVEHLRRNRFNWELLLAQESRAPPVP